MNVNRELTARLTALIDQQIECLNDVVETAVCVQAQVAELERRASGKRWRARLPKPPRPLH